MINMEQERKLFTVSIPEQQMIKWKITDKINNYQWISDKVIINNHKFVFYAERNSDKYKGLKIFTSLMPTLLINKGHNRSTSTVLEDYSCSSYNKENYKNLKEDVRLFVCHCMVRKF